MKTILYPNMPPKTFSETAKHEIELMFSEGNFLKLHASSDFNTQFADLQALFVIMSRRRFE